MRANSGVTPPGIERVATATTAGAADAKPARLGWILIQVAAFVVAGGVWGVASLLFPATTLPPPTAVLARLGELALTADFWSAVGITIVGQGHFDAHAFVAQIDSGQHAIDRPGKAEALQGIGLSARS